jgi:CheY-like chemotaxis protein
VSSPTLTLRPLNSLVAPKKKRVLLVDTSRAKRDLRSETMRKLGVEVDCAADIIEARSWWRADLYDLVLINVDSSATRDKFCDDIRKMTPLQPIMFLVGKPEYLAAAPGADQISEMQGGPVSNDMQLAMNLSEGVSQRWGILEACRRISAVRSVSDARSKAIRNRPAPPRDYETSHAKPVDRTEILAQLGMETAQ